MSNPVQVPNVVLSWAKATHNATYRLYKQGSSGNWSRIYQVKTNADPVTVPLSATDLGTGTLLKQNPDGAAIYHRFKLEVENASGLFSLNEKVLSVPATCLDGYAVLNQVVSYADDFQPAGPVTDQRPAVSTFPGSMTFRDIISALPAAHVFDRIEVTVADGLGHAARGTINAAGGAVTFHHGRNGDRAGRFRVEHHVRGSGQGGDRFLPGRPAVHLPITVRALTHATGMRLTVTVRWARRSGRRPRVGLALSCRRWEPLIRSRVWPQCCAPVKCGSSPASRRNVP